MKLKKGIAMILSIAMMCTLLPILPQSSEAATLTKLDPVKVGDDRVTCHFTDAKVGDDFQVFINGNPVNTGKLTQETLKYKSVYFKFGVDPVTNQQRKAKAGETIRVYMSNANGGLEFREVVVGGERKEKLPTSMKAEPETVKASDNAQVKLVFDGEYVANANDKVRVTGYDAKNGELDSYEVALPDDYTAPVSISLKDSAKTAYYFITFLPGNGSAPVLSTKVTVAAGEGGGEDTPDDKEQLGNAVGMIFKYPSNVVALGESVTPVIQLTDAKGESANYNGQVIFSYSGEAIDEGSFDNRGRFTVKSNKKYEGSKIYVTAMIGSFSNTVELTVQASGHKLVLSPASVGKGKPRSMNFQLYNSNDERIKLTWQPTKAIVHFRFPEGVEPNRFGNVTKLNNITKDGSGTIKVSCDQVTDAEVYIAFSDNDGHYYETGSAKVHFTEANQDAIKVVLNINSLDYTVNDISKTTDTKPIVKNNRTFVPFRLLAETLGSEVEFEPTTQTVTAVYEDTTVVMRIGEKKYTVNGVEKISDVAPYINSDKRTMVPLRVITEAFGCEVEPIYDPVNKTTVQVIFEKK